MGSTQGGDDTDVSGVDTVVAGAFSGCMCDLDSVSRGDVLVRVGEMSLPGGGDADVCGCDSLVSDGAGDSSSVGWMMTLLRMVMTHCCMTRFVLVAGCRWLVTP